MLRILDVVLSFFGLLFGWPIMLMIFFVLLFDTGSPIFTQVRVGRNQAPFKLLKFRTMRKDTADVATHLVDTNAITPVGRFLRRSRLDELPQLLNVLKGEMSMVGPRPCLFNQTELVLEREHMRIFDVRPGLTGLAQVSGIDMSNPKRLVELETKMLEGMTTVSYLKYVWITFFGVFFNKIKN